MAYIYKITNLINQKVYIGKTELPNPEDRWKEHKKEATRERSKTRAIYSALNKYGIENFSFEIIEEIIDNSLLCEREIYWIAKYNSYYEGYNETLGGDGASYIHLPEAEVCKYYLQCKSLKDTAKYFGHDVLTIKKVLIKSGITILSRQEVIKEKTSKSVAQIDKNTNEIIKIYPSIKEAERTMGNQRHISAVCKNKRKTAYGYKWKYLDEI